MITCKNVFVVVKQNHYGSLTKIQDFREHCSTDPTSRSTMSSVSCGIEVPKAFGSECEQVKGKSIYHSKLKVS